MQYPQSSYVVYVHQELDGTVRYVGSGFVSRAYSFDRSEEHQEWLSGKLDDYESHIKIVATGLTQGEARKLERSIIENDSEKELLFNKTFVGKVKSQWKSEEPTGILIKCVKCGEKKDSSLFGNDKRKVNGKRSWCKLCTSEQYHQEK